MKYLFIVMKISSATNGRGCDAPPVVCGKNTTPFFSLALPDGAMADSWQLLVRSGG